MERIEELRLLLERFYSGESTLEEERTLSALLTSQEVPEDLQADVELFIRMQEEDISVPDGLKGRIIKSLDHAAQQERRNRRVSLYSLSGLAAGILAIIAIYLGFLRNGEDMLTSQEYEDTYENPIDAYEEAKKTLAYVSVKLNRGTSELEYVQQISKQTTEPLRSLEKMNKGSRELNLLGQLQRVNEFEN